MLSFSYSKSQLKYALLIFFTLFIPFVHAQLKDPAISISLQPTLGSRFITYKGNFTQDFKDSLNKADRFRDAIGASILVSFQISKTRRMYTGLQFHNFGFTRRKEDIKFKDTIHPEIGIMNDLSQTGGAYADFNYQYMYLSLPLIFSNQISGKKLVDTKIHFTYGGSASVLIKHQIRAVLRGFSTRGAEKVHPLENKGSDPDRININAHFGMRVENKLFSKSTWVFVQPELLIPFLNANGGSQRHRLWALGLQIGIFYQPNKDKDKDK